MRGKLEQRAHRPPDHHHHPDDAMLRLRPVLAAGSLSRRYATAASPHALVLLEHRAGVIDSGSLSALTAAQQLGGQITGLVVGAPDEVKGVVEKAKK